MKSKILTDKKNRTIIKAKFDKHFSNKKYEIFFNTQSGLEVLKGCGDKPDPFFTDLPTLLDVGIMGHCKHNCTFCYQGTLKQPNMTLKNFRKIIDEVKYHTNQVALGGRGDPNKHRDFKKIVEYARKNNVVPNYTTSGVNLTDDEIEISKMCGAVAVSDYNMDYTYEAVQRLIDAGIKTNIHLMFTSGSFHKCLKVIYGHNPWKDQHYNFFNYKKLNAVVFLLFKPQGKGQNCLGFLPNSYQIKTISEVIQKPRNTFKIGMDSCLTNHVFKHTKIEGLNKLSLDSCESARMSAYITPDMKMMPCSFANHSCFAVDMNKKKIETIWKRSKEFRTFRKVLRKTPNTCPAGF